MTAEYIEAMVGMLEGFSGEDGERWYTVAHVLAAWDEKAEAPAAMIAGLEQARAFDE